MSQRNQPTRIKIGRQAEFDRWVELQASQRSLHAVDLDAASPARPDGVHIASVPPRPPKTGFYQSVARRHDEVKAREIAYASFYGIPAEEE